MRSIWSGTISFVLVNIPVKLYSATSSETINFDLLHKDDLSRIRYARVCQKEGDEVPYDELIRGFEFEKDQYVVVTNEELESADPKKTHSIDISAFIKQDEVDPIYYEKPYYLEPDKGAAKSYALLRDALKQSGKVAVAKFVLRERERLVLLRPYENVLILNQIRFQSEIRNPETLNSPAEKQTGEEVEMALSLIEKLTSSFKPHQYHDDYKEKILNLIEEKSKGKKIIAPTYTPQTTRVDELMDKLKESLAKTK